MRIAEQDKMFDIQIREREKSFQEEKLELLKQRVHLEADQKVYCYSFSSFILEY